MSDYPVLSTTPGRRDTALAPASLGTAGQRQRVNAGATAPEWSDPDLVCTAAELATTYAPSAVLRGVVAYTSDTLATYICRRTAAATYAWTEVGGGGGAPYAVIDAPLDAGQGWSIVAPTSGTAGTAAASFQGSGVARMTLTSAADSSVPDLTGPRIERAITWGAGKRWRVRVSSVAAVAPVAFGALSYGWLYLRNSDGSAYHYVEMKSADGDVRGAGGGTTPGLVSWGGAGTLELHVSPEGLVAPGVVSDAGLWANVASPTTIALTFVPTHVGVCGNCAGTSSGYVEFRDLVIEAFG